MITLDNVPAMNRGALQAMEFLRDYVLSLTTLVRKRRICVLGSAERLAYEHSGDRQCSWAEG